MNILPITKNALVLSLVCIVTMGFFIGGMLEILDYFIIKVLLFGSYGVLLFLAIKYALKNDIKKNRPEDKFQDDSH